VSRSVPFAGHFVHGQWTTEFAVVLSTGYLWLPVGVILQFEQSIATHLNRSTQISKAVMRHLPI
jgi:hypothetical protein